MLSENPEWCTQCHSMVPSFREHLTNVYEVKTHKSHEIVSNILVLESFMNLVVLGMDRWCFVFAVVW